MSTYNDGTRRADIKPGLHVFIVLKKDQGTDKLTEGIVQDILTNAPIHPRGIKVRLDTGEIGRVQAVQPLE
ncbi:YwbE family protein [Candidatus Uhrbacteria bacterium]|nr:YwbE family protein [Candidatus Uhrbacteria bacterium]